MTVVLSRRALLASGLGLTGAYIAYKDQRAQQLRTDFARNRLLAAPRDPLYVAMLDEHASSAARCPSALIGRRISISGLESRGPF